MPTWSSSSSLSEDDSVSREEQEEEDDPDSEDAPLRRSSSLSSSEELDSSSMACSRGGPSPRDSGTSTGGPLSCGPQASCGLGAGGAAGGWCGAGAIMASMSRVEVKLSSRVSQSGGPSSSREPGPGACPAPCLSMARVWRATGHMILATCSEVTLGVSQCSILMLLVLTVRSKYAILEAVLYT